MKAEADKTALDKAGIEPRYISPNAAAEYSGRSRWTINDELRRGCYDAVKSGRRTLILFPSFKKYLATLPPAKFATPSRKSSSKRGGR